MNIMSNKKKIGEITYSIEINKQNNPFLHHGSLHNARQEEENRSGHNSRHKKEEKQIKEDNIIEEDHHQQNPSRKSSQIKPEPS